MGAFVLTKFAQNVVAENLHLLQKKDCPVLFAHIVHLQVFNKNCFNISNHKNFRFN